MWEKQNMIEDTKMPRKANLEHYLNWTYIKKWHHIQSKPFGSAQRQKKMRTLIDIILHLIFLKYKMFIDW